MATIAFLALLCVVFRVVNCLARGIAQRQLDSHRLPPPRRPARGRVPPPVTQARLLLSAGEWPTAALAMLAGRRSRARLRLILAMRRAQSLDRYYARLGRLHDDPDDRLVREMGWGPSDDGMTIDLHCSPSPPSQKPERVKIPDAFEDASGALEFAIAAMFAVPPNVLGRSAHRVPSAMPLVVHLKPRDYGDQKIRRSWVEADYLLSPYLDGHPVGTPCGVCAQANILAVRQAGSSEPPASLADFARPMGLGRWTTPTYRLDDDRWLP
jgi:hypothetical protein